MPYNEKLVNRVREALARQSNVKETKMSTGVLFMVNGKVCITVKDDEISCRIDPALQQESIAKKGCRTMQMKGKDFIGYITVTEEGMKSKKDFEHWINLALDFNQKAKASPASKKK